MIITYYQYQCNLPEIVNDIGTIFRPVFTVIDFTWSSKIGKYRK